MTSIDSMMKNIKEYLKKSKTNDSIFGIAFEEGAVIAIYKSIIQDFKKKLKILFHRGARKPIFFPIKTKIRTHLL